MILTKSDLEHDAKADAQAEIDAERDAIIDDLWDASNWDNNQELLELITQHKDFDDAMRYYIKGDFSHLTALCDEAKEFLILREAEKILKKKLANNGE